MDGNDIKEELPDGMTSDEAVRRIIGSLYPKAMQEAREVEAERDRLDERCKSLLEKNRALEEELAKTRARVNKPLRDAWLGEAIGELAEKCVVYRPDLKFHSWPDKCPDCDDDRNIAFTSPQGLRHKETCEKCGYRIVAYEPEELVLAKVEKAWPRGERPDGSTAQVLHYAPRNADGFTAGNIVDLKEVVDCIPESMGVLFPADEEGYTVYHDTLFASEDDCRKACEWINEREGYPKKEEKWNL